MPRIPTPPDHKVIANAVSTYDGCRGDDNLAVYKLKHRIVLEVRGRMGALKSQLIVTHAEARELARDILAGTD
ncbi:hypothetical protein LCGC14_1965040 [marine sediment metagenome]|uniref:Uncharacterized protein n=1 Tax=marine sediment metagenome TaxID=412755 RepID=A0A0F9G1T7_9ZZZZ